MRRHRTSHRMAPVNLYDATFSIMTKRKASSKDECPSCDGALDRGDLDVAWVMCSLCRQWHHARCLALSPLDLNELQSFHCPPCAQRSGPLVNRRRLKRTRSSIDYVALNEGNAFAIDKLVHPHTHAFLNYASAAKKPVDIGVNVTKLQCLLGLVRPVHITHADLDVVGMKLPCNRRDITVPFITEAVGPDTPVEVMDVLTQQGVKPGWDLAQWRDYFATDALQRDRIRNVISLEISDLARLGGAFERPQMVREMDVVDKVWLGGARPKVTKYCLMSVAGSFTDFHIDFGGTSVYYTVCAGAKQFLMFPPTPHNLKLYAKWCLEPDQNFLWFPLYQADTRAGAPQGGFKVALAEGDLFFIPSGWIHAVYTPEDSVVIGGNYLTLADLEMQLQINAIERDTKVPSRFRFPDFNKVWWLASVYFYENPQQLTLDLADSRSAKHIMGVLVDHLRSHWQLSKTYKPARASIPTQLVGRDPLAHIDKLAAWYQSL
jgi:F-box/leucine-rich repeat protein 10/11